MRACVCVLAVILFMILFVILIVIRIMILITIRITILIMILIMILIVILIMILIVILIMILIMILIVILIMILIVILIMILIVILIMILFMILIMILIMILRYQVDVSASVPAEEGRPSGTFHNIALCGAGTGGVPTVSAARRVGFRSVAMDSALATPTSPQRHACVRACMRALLCCVITVCLGVRACVRARVAETTSWGAALHALVVACGQNCAPFTASMIAERISENECLAVRASRAVLCCCQRHGYG